MTLGQAVSDLLLWAFGGLATLFAGVGGVVKRNRDRSIENARRLEGDAQDDNYPGLMEMVYDNNVKLDKLEDRMDREHRGVMARLDEIADGDYDAEE